jgi:ABC-2 type transport system permease protein
MSLGAGGNSYSIRQPALDMRKYWYVINIGIQNTLVYRVNFLARSLFGLVPLLATLYLWRAIYRTPTGGDAVAGYSLAKMTSYYLAVSLVDMLTAVTDDDWQIAADIKDGNISQFLLKPMDYLHYRLCLFAANRLVYTLVALGPTLLFFWWQREYVVLPSGGTSVFLFVVSLVLAALQQFYMSFTMALLAFWVLDVSGFIIMLFAFEYLAGGHLFPLDILPPVIAQILNYTPFPYQLFFPISIYLGQTTGLALAWGFLLQGLWVLAFYGLARWVWRRGITKYSAVGG